MSSVRNLLTGKKSMKCEFSENLKYLRLEKSLSQTKLARLMGVSQSSISEWENNVREPFMSYLLRLAEIFEVSLDYLCGLADW